MAERCTFVNEKNERCSNKLGVYSRYCWRHSDLVDNLQVKKSNVKGGGYGLYAGSKGFRKGEYVARYGWPHNYVSLKALESKCKSKTGKAFQNCWGHYIFCDGKHCWDGRKKSSTIARYANDCHGTNFKCSGEFQMIDDIPYIVATRDIKPGEEIFVNYGEEYWG